MGEMKRMLLLLVVVGTLCAGVVRGQEALVDGQPESMADLGEVLTNTSSVLGGSVSFYCEVIGSQTVGEKLIFSKVDEEGDAEAISSDNDILDTSKYEVTEKYRLKVKDITWDDEGEYRCALGVKPSRIAYMVVSDPPTDAEAYWPGDKDWTEENVKANLTCKAGSSRPPATFRWFRGATEITGISINPSVSVDSNGYGHGISMLELVPTKNEEGVLYSCHADVPGKENAVVTKINVSFSGAGNVVASICLVLTCLLASYRV